MVVHLPSWQFQGSQLSQPFKLCRRSARGEGVPPCARFVLRQPGLPSRQSLRFRRYRLRGQLNYAGSIWFE